MVSLSVNNFIVLHVMITSNFAVESFYSVLAKIWITNFMVSGAECERSTNHLLL